MIMILLLDDWYEHWLHVLHVKSLYLAAILDFAKYFGTYKSLVMYKILFITSWLCRNAWLDIIPPIIVVFYSFMAYHIANLPGIW